MKKAILVCIVLFLAIGCTSASLKLPTAMPNAQYDELGEGEGSAIGIMLFNMIPIGQNERFVNAYENAVKSKDGDALLNPVISERWFWAYALNGYITTVNGTVIKYKK